MPSANILIKDPDESRLYNIDFAALLASGETLSSSTVTSTPTGLTVGTPAISGTKVQVRLSSGTSGTVYTITATVSTSSSNTLEDCVRLLVQSCGWMTEMVRIVRILINDASDTPTYSDMRIAETILVAAHGLDAEVDFDTDYTINLSTLTLSPDPTTVRDDVFINLACLKAACLIDNSTFRTKAASAGIKVTDKMGSISTDGMMGGYKDILLLGNCAMLKESLHQYRFGNKSFVRAVLTPFTSATVSLPFYGDNRNRDFS